MDHLPVRISIEGQVDETIYPLSAVDDLFYQLLDDLAGLETKHDVDVKFPITRTYKNTFGHIDVSLHYCAIK